MVIVGMFIENTMGRMYANFQYCVSTFKPFPASVTTLLPQPSYMLYTNN